MTHSGLLLDSTTTLPDGYVETHGITVIPVPIYASGREYRNGIDIDEEGFLRLLETSKDRPSTAVPGIGEFVSWYERVLGDHRNVIYPIASRRLSGLFNAAVQAGLSMDGASVVALDPEEGQQDGVVAMFSGAKDPEQQLARVAGLPPPVIVVLNSDSVSGGVGLIAIHGCDAIDRGSSLEGVLARMIACKSTLRLHFILSSLDYVVDRVGQLQVLLGTMLQIRPVMAINNGMVEDVAKARGRSRSKHQMLELTRRHTGDRLVDVVVLHSREPDEAQALLEETRACLNVHRSWVTGIGCTVSRYTGRGGLGIVVADAQASSGA
jgi:fatty acid-binding protein DegV